MGLDRKYGKVITEFGHIGTDEPVVVFRAQDGLLAETLVNYMLLCKKHGSPQRHIDIVKNTLETVLEWQVKNGSRIPNSESSRDRLVD